jgi:gliding motility-associated-like protein
VLFRDHLYKLFHLCLQGAIYLSLGLNPYGSNAQSPQQRDNIITDCPRSQKQADIWYFGDKAGIDFRTGTAVPLTGKDTMISFKSSAVISDSLGKLLFFTDGKRVWNRNFGLMTNANSLEGDLGATQPTIIIPAPLNNDKYYIFTTDVMTYQSDNTFSTNGLRYTIIDMTMWGNKGDARDTMNFPLLNPVCQKLTAVKHKNRLDYWVIAHEWNSSRFYAWLVNSSGISSPVISEVGSFMGGGYIDQNNASGYMKASPDGSKIALAISGLNKLELYDFDNSSGIISNPESYTTTDPGISPYGIEFSPDNKKLYVSLLQLTGNGPPIYPSKIYQFDLLSGLNNPELVAATHGVRAGGLQLAVDGRIYVSRTINLRQNKDSLDVIYNPTRPGKECNYNLLDSMPNSRFSLKGRKSIYGLPTFIQTYFDIPLFTYDSVCFRDTIHFNITNKANIDSVLWDFGDGMTSAIRNPAHFYANPGTFTVKLTETFSGKSYTESAVVTILKLLDLNLSDTALLYPESSINLHAGGGHSNYGWSTGENDSVFSTDSIINVVKEGNYIVHIKDQNCCSSSDTVYVKPFLYYAPSAFTPNGDGKNDVFRLVGLYDDIEMNLKIYTRKGDLIFTSDNLYQGWDGTFNGTPSPMGTYLWIANFKFLSQDIITYGDVVLKGTVTLLR